MNEVDYYKLFEIIKSTHSQLEEFRTYLEEKSKRLGLDNQNRDLTDKKAKIIMDGMTNFYSSKLENIDKLKRRLADMATE